MVVVEVRQGTLGVDRGSQLDEDDEDDKDDKDDKEDEEDEEEEEERRTRQEEEEEATDIKSNNPHLAGGEKIWSLAELFRFWRWFRSLQIDR